MNNILFVTINTSSVAFSASFHCFWCSSSLLQTPSFAKCDQHHGIVALLLQSQYWKWKWWTTKFWCYSSLFPTGHPLRSTSLFYVDPEFIFCRKWKWTTTSLQQLWCASEFKRKVVSPQHWKVKVEAPQYTAYKRTCPGASLRRKLQRKPRNDPGPFLSLEKNIINWK